MNQRDFSLTADAHASGALGQIADNLGTLFRHLLPGVLIIGSAWVIRPSWFVRISADWPHLAVVGAVAVAVGNAWFSVNRYGVHQIVDYVCWRAGLEGPAKKANSTYANDLASYVREAVVDSEAGPVARRHVAFRASSVLLLYTLSELLFVAGVCSEPDAVTSAHTRLLLTSAVILFVGAIWQNILTRRIDAAVLHRGRVPNSRN